MGVKGRGSPPLFCLSPTLVLSWLQLSASSLLSALVSRVKYRNLWDNSGKWTGMESVRPLCLPSCQITRAEGAWGSVFIGGEVKDCQVGLGTLSAQNTS